MTLTTRVLARWKDLRQRLPPPVVRFLGAFIACITRVDLFDRSMTLAAQAFVSVFPLVIAVATLRGGGDELAAWVARALSLPPGSETLIEGALPASDVASTSFGVLSVLLIILSATSFSRALARMYARVWGVGYPGLAGWWRWVVVILVVATTTAGLRILVGSVGDGVMGVLGLVATGVTAALLWTWVPWVLLAGVVPWNRLVPGGALMGVGTVITTLASTLYLPRALTQAAAFFGSFGVAFTFIGWLFAVAFVLITTTVIGSALAPEAGPRGEVPASP